MSLSYSKGHHFFLNLRQISENLSAVLDNSLKNKEDSEIKILQHAMYEKYIEYDQGLIKNSID